MPDLRAFMRSARRRPFVWGEFDCCLFAADWVALCTGRDPAATWRGTYSTETEARALMDSAGGMSGLLDAVLHRSDDPAVGILETPQGEACAIRAGNLWAVLTPGGTGLVRGQATGWGLCLK